MAYLEAAASGLPSLGTRVGGVPEAVVDGVTGILVEPGNHEALVAALTRLLGDESYRSQLGQNAKSNCRRFTWKRCAELTYSD